ncbi:signal transduction histidine kinase [Terrimicrobium sacchariphilum]|uniref:Sensory/regulatory protein RpfC n=1 Tax=Terrimicrobium sacchariphilum TaxID=690879 RepID=A0A146G3X6_TERSA|nr:ATP-binding protein [Terrimicrobium sacchariphilum]GAT31516.1 signal transduction histidine kinase [Terrimicrobium sacchariphilum]
MSFAWQFFVALIASGLAFALSAIAYRRVQILATRPYAIALVLVGIWCILAAAEVSSTTVADKVLLLKLRFTILPFVPLLFAEAVHRLVKGTRFLVRERLYLSLIIPLSMLVVAWTPRLGSLWIDDIRLTRNSEFAVLVYRVGPMTIVYFTFVAVFAITALYWLAAHLRHAPPWSRRGEFLMFMSGLLPTAVNGLFMVGWSPTMGFNYTPIVLAFTAWLAIWALLGSRMDDLAPVARVLLVEHLKECLIVIDSRGLVLDLNRAACRAFDVAAKVALDRPVQRLLRGWSGVTNLLEQRAVENVEVEVSAGGIWECSIIPVPEDAEEPSARIILLRDVTERKVADKLVQQAREEAENANRAKGRFLATMSHEVRTPMNGVIGFLDLLKTTQLSEEQADYVNLIADSSQSLLCILNDVLDYSKIEAGGMQIEHLAFSLRDVVGRVCRLQLPAAKLKGLILESKLAPDVEDIVVGDSLRLGQILTNLVSNAVKFTSTGRIDLLVKRGEGDAAIFEVIDTGIGIQSHQLSRLFKPFAQADSSTTRQFGGSGLGLVIAQSLSRMMGGDITVTSTPGEGTRFVCVVNLPAAGDRVTVNR